MAVMLPLYQQLADATGCRQVSNGAASTLGLGLRLRGPPSGVARESSGPGGGSKLPVTCKRREQAGGRAQLGLHLGVVRLKYHPPSALKNK